MAVLQFGIKLVLILYISSIWFVHVQEQLKYSCFYFPVVLYFLGPGFGSDAANPHLPHNHEQNQVVYTGTHDNDTVLVLLFHLLSLEMLLDFHL